MNNKGFAASGILYTILLVFLAIMMMAIFNFESKKHILDQLKSDVAGEFDTGCSLESNTVYDFDYTGDIQEFSVPCSGKYKIEVWGAQGGTYDTTYRGGYGSYSVGQASLNKNEKLYIAVGEKGSYSLFDYDNLDGGYNGGGGANAEWSGGSNQREYHASGGGATHIAITNNRGELKNYDSNQNDILIVSGGGGGFESFTADNGYKCDLSGGDAGGIEGSRSVTLPNGCSYLSYISNYTNATQISPGTGQYSSATSNIASFGTSVTNGSYSGGGGGWYGGAGTWAATGGGSSYIGSSNLVSGNGITKHMTCYNCQTSNDVNTKTISNTCHNATATSECSKEGHGHARITYLGDASYVLEPNTKFTFDYINGEQTFIVPYAGKYKLEVWGAQGGIAQSTVIGGYGGYSVGTTSLIDGDVLYINVGGVGTEGNISGPGTGGYNGGGNGTFSIRFRNFIKFIISCD